MLYAAIDIYKRAFQAAVLDPESGEVVEERVSWIPPEEIQLLRDRTRLRKALAEDRRRWGQRLHAYLLHEGWPCSRSNLLRPPGLRWAASLRLPEHARLHVDSLLSVMAALEAQLDSVDAELRRFAGRDERCQALPPHLRWALVEAAVHAHRPTHPDLGLYRATRERRHTAVARLTIARKIGKQAFHALRELELATT
jgi:hypothetical protein